LFLLGKGALWEAFTKEAIRIGYSITYGKPYQESSRSTKEADAKRLLRKREGEIAEGKLPGSYFDKVRFDELADNFLADYRISGGKSLVRAECSVAQLKRFFEGMRVTNITTQKVHKYTEMRLGEGAAHGTVNRELAALKRMLNIGATRTPALVNRVPYIQMLKEAPPRQGFFEHAEFLTLIKVLPEYLKGFTTFAYKTGWRSAEIKSLTWSQVDLDQGIVRLEPGSTKNDEGRTVYLDDELKEIIHKQWEARKKSEKLTSYVFPNRSNTGRIKDFRDGWYKACKQSGIGKKLFHDLRRTAIRNMVRAGTPERIVMMISGHKTRAVFDRYNIVSDDDLKLAAAKQESYLKSKTTAKTVTVGNFSNKANIAKSSYPTDFIRWCERRDSNPHG